MDFSLKTIFFISLPSFFSQSSVVKFRRLAFVFMRISKAVIFGTSGNAKQ